VRLEKGSRKCEVRKKEAGKVRLEKGREVRIRIQER